LLVVRRSTGDEHANTRIENHQNDLSPRTIEMGDDGRLKVIIAGAGIAGLATAIALRRLPNVDVELYERSTELQEIGASIALSPNVRSLQ
jgi:salicylate hydroxylase